jgi:outer membrane protein assembly factor BamB
MSFVIIRGADMLRLTVASSLLFAILLPDLCADGPKDKLAWPQFLGPNRDGIIRDSRLNTDWKARPPKTLWKVPLGSAYSSLAIVNDRIYTLAKRGQRDGAICLDAKSGKEVWFFDAVPDYIDVQKQGAGPRSTPAYQDGKLYCLFAMGELFCLTADGKKRWQADIFKDTGAQNHAGERFYWGVSMSPLVEGDAVIVQPGGEKDNSVAAYHKDTGKLLWKAGSDPMGYASPIAVSVAGQRQVIVPTGRSVLGIDPNMGRVLWRYEFGNKFNATGASPLWSENLLFVSAAYGAGCAALEILPPDRTTAAWTVREKWRNDKKFQNLMATSMIVNGHLYGCHGDLSAFALRCLDLKTGAVKWEERAAGRFGFLAFERHIICVGERGTVQLLEATPAAYKVNAVLPDLLAYKTWAAPAFADGRLYLRDSNNLLCLDLRK